VKPKGSNTRREAALRLDEHDKTPGGFVKGMTEGAIKG
jgi:hypothetical protein